MGSENGDTRCGLADSLFGVTLSLALRIEQMDEVLRRARSFEDSSSQHRQCHVYYGSVNYVNHVENAAFEGNSEPWGQWAGDTKHGCPPNTFVLFGCSMLRSRGIPDLNASHPGAVASIISDAWGTLSEFDRKVIEEDALALDRLRPGLSQYLREVAIQHNEYWKFATQLTKRWKGKWNQMRRLVVRRAEALAETSGLSRSIGLSESSSSDARRLALGGDVMYQRSVGTLPGFPHPTDMEPPSRNVWEGGFINLGETSQLPVNPPWGYLPPNAFAIFGLSMISSHISLDLKRGQSITGGMVVWDSWGILSSAERQRVELDASRSEELHSAMVGSESKGIGAATQKAKYCTFAGRVAELWAQRWDELKGFVLKRFGVLARGFRGWMK